MNFIPHNRGDLGCIKWLNWKPLATSAIFLFICGCGWYVGTEGVIYQPDDLTGFRTPAVDAQIEKDRQQAYEDGKAERELSEASELDDGSVTVATGDQIMEAGGSTLANLLPYGGAASGLLLIIIGIFKRKKNKNV